MVAMVDRIRAGLGNLAVLCVRQAARLRAS